jgi:hypothetical protein
VYGRHCSQVEVRQRAALCDVCDGVCEVLLIDVTRQASAVEVVTVVEAAKVTLYRSTACFAVMLLTHPLYLL